MKTSQRMVPSMQYGQWVQLRGQVDEAVQVLVDRLKKLSMALSGVEPCLPTRMGMRAGLLGTRIRRLLTFVSHQTGMSEPEILGRRRTTALVDARHLFFWLCTRLLQLSGSEVARITDRDPGTVNYARSAILERASVDAHFAAHLERMASAGADFLNSHTNQTPKQNALNL